MIKAVSLSLGFICLLAPVTGISQTVSAEDAAVNQAVLNQANTLVLRQKLADAQNAANRGDVAGAAKLYEEAYSLVEQIGSGIDAETAQTVTGLTATRMELAREAQGRGDLLDADKEITRVLKVNPHYPAAIAFKRQNDQMIAAQKGKVPDPATLETLPAVAKQKTDAATLVQDGKVFYEMGKLDEADAKLNQALSLDPDNRAALYYLNLVKQTRFSRSESRTTLANSDRIVQVQQAWDKPLSGVALTDGNPYATTNLIYTGLGRQAIVNKLNRIRLSNVLYDGLPLSEVIRNLSEQSKLRDPDKVGINFLINPNAPAAESGSASVNPGAPGGFGGAPGGFGGAPAAVDPATGLPITAPSANNGAEQVDVGSVIIKINPALNDVRLADVLDAIVQVADHPIKYSIEDYAIVFSSRGPQSAQLSMRTFRVDPNTFYSGLESVSSSSFGSANNSSGGSGGSGGSSGGSSGGGSGNNNNVGSVIAVVNASPGAGGFRSSGGNGGGGGGGGGGGQQGAPSLLENPGVGGANGVGGGNAGNNNAQGGLAFITRQTSAATPSALARQFFSSLGVNMDYPPGKSVFFNDRLGLLFVRATDQDLDIIERAIQALNQVAPQVHIKARFIELTQQDDKALGFDWYLGQFGSGSVVASGGSAPSLNVPGPGGSVQSFPGPTTANQIASSAADQLITGGLRNSLGAPALATVTGILTDPNFRVVINALQQRSGVETLAEPEATTTSGRQVQMRATQLQTVVTGVNFQQGAVGGTGTGTAVP